MKLSAEQIFPNPVAGLVRISPAAESGHQVTEDVDPVFRKAVQRIIEGTEFLLVEIVPELFMRLRNHFRLIDGDAEPPVFLFHKVRPVEPDKIDAEPLHLFNIAVDFPEIGCDSHSRSAEPKGAGWILSGRAFPGGVDDETIPFTDRRAGGNPGEVEGTSCLRESNGTLHFYGLPVARRVVIDDLPILRPDAVPVLEKPGCFQLCRAHVDRQGKPQFPGILRDKRNLHAGEFLRKAIPAAERKLQFTVRGEGEAASVMAGTGNGVEIDFPRFQNSGRDGA